MTRPPWLTGPRLEPYEREQIRTVAAERRRTTGALDAPTVRALQGAYNVSRRTVYRLAGPPDQGGDNDR